MDISLIWFIIIGLGVLIYVLLDGFDLGLGILFPFVKTKEERDVMMNTVAPIWDGNETWMVLGGAALFGAFPLAYSLVLSSLYLPMVLMAVCLIFRGVAFEFRFKSLRHQAWWDWSFALGSALTGFLQGVILGAIIQGIKMQDGVFAGNLLDWLTPFTLLVGAGVVAMYAVLGATWLIIKTEGSLQHAMFQLTPTLLKVLCAMLVLLGIATPWVSPHYAQRWFHGMNLVGFALMAAGVLLALWQIQAACKQKNDKKPFIYTVIMAILTFITFVLTLFPYMVPPSLDIWQAAAPAVSQKFALIGAVILLPVILAYTAFSYWVFRDKVRLGDKGYH